MATSLACYFDRNAALGLVVDKQTHAPEAGHNTLLVPGNIPQLVDAHKLYSVGCCSDSQIVQHCADDNAYYATHYRAQMQHSKRKY